MRYEPHHKRKQNSASFLDYLKLFYACTLCKAFDAVITASYSVLLRANVYSTTYNKLSAGNQQKPLSLLAEHDNDAMSVQITIISPPPLQITPFSPMLKPCLICLTLTKRFTCSCKKANPNLSRWLQLLLN